MDKCFYFTFQLCFPAKTLFFHHGCRLFLMVFLQAPGRENKLGDIRLIVRTPSRQTLSRRKTGHRTSRKISSIMKVWYKVATWFQTLESRQGKGGSGARFWPTINWPLSRSWDAGQLADHHVWLVLGLRNRLTSWWKPGRWRRVQQKPS